MLALHAAQPQRYPFLLQSLGGSGRWDILFSFPLQHIPYFSGTENEDFLSRLDRLWQMAAAPVPVERDLPSLPFQGGWFLYCAYELLREFEPSVDPRHDEAQPLAWLTRIPAAVIIDREQGASWFFAEQGHESCFPLLQQDLASLTEFQADLRVEDLQEEDADRFLQGVRRIKHYIQEGDVFQVNLARLWQANLTSGNAASLYARLREKNPAPFAGLADFGDWQIVSSSPERLVRQRAGVLETRPIAGTHPRAVLPEDDAEVKRALVSSAKERAEHIMLVDLERNDLGRICQPGSVSVEELMAVNSYAHVHHIESSIKGQLREGVTPGQIIRALFPGGTITGCPKVRTMQIIAELETSPRLAYTGSMGYLNHDGSLDLNILIRTFMLQGGSLTFKAGAGIVADSDPERELAETRAKAKGLLRSLGLEGGLEDS